jgi:tetrapyrrole methylase family protein/MazG family protein
MPKAPQDLEKFESLIELVASLRGPDGCPWNQEQTHKTLAPYAVEETYELVEALEQNDDQKLKEELGDVLFQVALHAQLAQERGAFTIDDVLRTLNEKMVRRHPHVFSGVQVENLEAVWQNWEKIKKAEKAAKETLGGVKKVIDIPEHIPALQRAYKIGVKTQKAGFDWSNPEQVFEKVQEEVAEVAAEIPGRNLERLEIEIGDLLFSVAQLARHFGFEPEQTLRGANRKFLDRYEGMHALCFDRSLNFENLSLDEKEKLWAEVKKRS